MTDCPNGALRDLLPDLLHDRLAPAERSEVEAHVRSCTDCAAELALLRSLRASMSRVPTVNASRIAAAIPAHRPPMHRQWVGWRTAAAIMVLLAGGTSLLVVQRNGSSLDTARILSETASASAPVQGAVATTPSESAGATVVASAPARHATVRELAVANGVTSDLSDHELQILLKDIESIDAVPSVDVDSAPPLLPIPPRGSSE